MAHFPHDKEPADLLRWQRQGHAPDGRTNVALAQAQAPLSTNLLERFTEVRAESDRLFGIVAPGALYERPIPERHRIAFYIGHLEAFDWNLFRENGIGAESFDPAYDRLFAFGIDPVDGGLPTDAPADWPALDEIAKYTARIRAALDERLPEYLTRGATSSGFPAATIVEAAIEHRLMHVETLAYMLHQLPLEKKVRPRAGPAANPAGEALSAASVAVPGGRVTLGLPRSPERFGWDNEFEAHTVAVPVFHLDKYKVTNSEYLEFLNAGGYRNKTYWAEEDWKWKEQSRIEHPVFWTTARNGWFYRGMFDLFPLPPGWPVYVSHAEASAYARWAGKRLPSEAQWQRAAFADASSGARAEGNFDFQRWDPIPVQSTTQSASPFGAVGMTGNGWEWTRTVFEPFSGFRAFSFYPGYSANFFDGQHYVMKGASARTAACMARPSFRNWFQKRYQYVYAGFRCVSERADK